jgi:tripartite-type tricarboxylate transporter receptor subunit TctC
MTFDRIDRRQLLTTALGSAALGSALWSSSMLAQSVQTAKILLGFPAGGSNDSIARQLAERLRGQYASTVIVENRVGAQGRFAVEAVKDAAPDGMTILQTPGTILTIYPHVYKRLSYDPLKDLTPVTAVSKFDPALAVAPSMPVKTPSEFIDWCKKNPDKAMYGSPSAGTSPHFVGVMLARAAGISLQHIAYKGAAPAVQDLLGGHLPAYMGIVGDVMEHHRRGTVRIIATSGPSRSRFTPDVMTFEESGFPKVVAQDWFGLFLPANAPSHVVTNLHRAVSRAMTDQSMLDSLTRIGVDPAVSEASAFADQLKRELASWADVVKASGFRIDD